MNEKSNSRKIIYSFLIVSGTAILFYFLTVLFLLFTGIGDLHAGDDFDWQSILNDPNRTFSILCNGGTYMLTYNPPDKKSNSGGIAIASSSKDLEQFCNKKVAIQATGRAFRAKPLCTEQLKKENSVFCNAKLPVVDIHTIEEL